MVILPTRTGSGDVKKVCIVRSRSAQERPKKGCKGDYGTSAVQPPLYRHTSLSPGSPPTVHAATAARLLCPISGHAMLCVRFPPLPHPEGTPRGSVDRLIELCNRTRNTTSQWISPSSPPQPRRAQERPPISLR
jgi:hypothetical protein